MNPYASTMIVTRRVTMNPDRAFRAWMDPSELAQW